jgi:membrane protein YdbS with pleckstrin-like domain
MNIEHPHPHLLQSLRHSLFHLRHEEDLTDEQKRLLRRRRVQTIIYVLWGLIIAKSFLVVWAVNHFAIPFSPLWVIAPTVTFAFVATAAYYLMRD